MSDQQHPANLKSMIDLLLQTNSSSIIKEDLLHQMVSKSMIEVWHPTNSKSMTALPHQVNSRLTRDRTLQVHSKSTIDLEAPISLRSIQILELRASSKWMMQDQWAHKHSTYLMPDQLAKLTFRLDYRAQSRITVPKLRLKWWILICSWCQVKVNPMDL